MAKKLKTGRVVLLVLLLVLIAGGGAAYLYINGLLGRVADQLQMGVSGQPQTITEDVVVEIPAGSGSAAISKLLYEAHLTQNSEIFRRYAGGAGIDVQLRAGEYLFTAGEWTLEEIGQLLVKGGNISHDIRVTIPEGLTVENIALRFAEAGLCDAEDFLRYAEEGGFSQSYIPAMGTAITPASRLEGFLAPDTYMIDPAWQEQQIIDMLLNQFNQVWWTDEYQARADELGMSVTEVVTLASIIEKEAAVAEDRPIISGVFHKRLEIGMLLQSCATIQFLLGEPKVPLLNSDLEIESPYNTYKYAGLPPGPIAVPGRAALEAALWPTETDYLYFRARTDGSHRFSVTFQEHNKKQPGDQ